MGIGVLLTLEPRKNKAACYVVFLSLLPGVRIVSTFLRLELTILSFTGGGMKAAGNRQQLGRN
jgi:hypothetical protein